MKMHSIICKCAIFSLLLSDFSAMRSISYSPKVIKGVDVTIGSFASSNAFFHIFILSLYLIVAGSTMTTSALPLLCLNRQTPFPLLAYYFFTFHFPTYAPIYFTHELVI